MDPVILNYPDTPVYSVKDYRIDIFAFANYEELGLIDDEDHFKGGMLRGREVLLLPPEEIETLKQMATQAKKYALLCTALAIVSLATLFFVNFVPITLISAISSCTFTYAALHNMLVHSQAKKAHIQQQALLIMKHIHEASSPPLRINYYGRTIEVPEATLKGKQAHVRIAKFMMALQDDTKDYHVIRHFASFL